MNTLTELRTQIGLWSERTDISDDQLDNFIKLTEQGFKGDLLLPPNEQLVTLVTDANGKITIPSDYIATKSMYVLDSNGNKKPLYRKPNEFVQAGSSIDATSATSYFEREGNYFIFSPNPGEGVNIYLTYYSVIPSLIDTDAAETGAINFVMSVMPTVYLFGSLMFLFMYTFNEERAAYYKNLYDLAIQELIKMQENAEMSGSSLHVVPTISDDGSTW